MIMKSNSIFPMKMLDKRVGYNCLYHVSSVV